MRLERQRRRIGLAGAAALAAALVPGPLAHAQDTGGTRLTFTLAAGVAAEDNPSLLPGGSPARIRGTARLGFGLASETRVARFALDAGARAVANGGGRAGLVDPFLTLAYGRDWADAGLTLDAAVRETDLAGIRSVEDFDVSATGTRRTLSLAGRFEFGRDGPAGIVLDAGLTRTEYRDAAPGLVDSETWQAGIAGRFEPDAATRIDAGVRGSRFTRAGFAPRESLAFTLAVARTDARGTTTLDLGATAAPEGLRLSALAGRRMDLPAGALAFRAGLERGAAGRVHPVGGIDWRQDLPQGTLTAALSRRLGASSIDDSEQIVTAASVGFSRPLDALTGFSLTASWAQSESTATGATTANTALGASVRRELTPDWGLDVGVRHRIRSQTGVPDARGTEVFLEIGRSWTALR